MKRSMISAKLGVLVLVAAVAVCPYAVAADANEAAGAAKKEVLTPLEQRMEKRIDVAFIDTDIDAVIRAIAAKADLNVVKSPKVTGTVTATLTNVPLREALSNILAANGYGYVVDKNVIRVAPLEELTQAEERLVSKVYRITYADVDQVQQALSKFISQRGSISANPGTSNIIVTDTETKIKAIDTFVAEIDRITPQILVEARIYDITVKDRLDLGIEWQAARDTGTGATLGAAVGSNRRPFINATVSGDTEKTTSIGTLRMGWLSGGLDIDALIHAEKEIANAKLLANPRIMVLDNETALFDIVTEHPYAENNISAGGITQTIKWRNVGVKLEVTPHVTRDGMIRLHIVPEFGIVVRNETFDVGPVPVIDTRKVDTLTLVENGQTVVIGGLRKKDVSHQINKIPLLGDLPLLGALFRFEGEDVSNTELVVFITPKVVEQPITMSHCEKEAYRTTEFARPPVIDTRSEKQPTQGCIEQ